MATVHSAAAEDGQPLRAGMIGLDTSHAPAFAELLNGPEAKDELAGVKVVAAFPGGSPDLQASASRVDDYTKKLAAMGIEIVPSIEALLPKVDVVLLESVDGRPHLKQVLPVLRAGKPVFIDKPVAGTLADAIVIFDEARRLRVPCFSSSSLRFSRGILGMRNDPRVGKVVGCEAHGPCELEPHHPDLFWYGIHGVESLFTIMGTGCRKVSRVHTDGTDLAVGVWEDGRIGTFRGLRAARTATAPRFSATRGSCKAAATTATSRWWSRSSDSSRASSRRSAPTRRSRFTPSWKPPTRASVKAAPQCRSTKSCQKPAPPPRRRPRRSAARKMVRDVALSREAGPEHGPDRPAVPFISPGNLRGRFGRAVVKSLA